MRLSQPKPAFAKKTSAALSLLCLLVWPAAAELQAGRDAKGTLWLSDQGLPAGVRPLPDINSAVMDLPPPTAAPPVTSTPRPPATDAPPHRSSPKNKATCDGIEQRYSEARDNLAKIEQDKASGKRLIPESGLISMRQNLATLERLQTLCQ